MSTAHSRNTDISIAPDKRQINGAPTTHTIYRIDPTASRVEFTIGVSYDVPAAKLALIPTIMRDAIEDQPKTRFDRAHFKQYGENALIFEAAFYFSDPDYNRYMDAQQAINLAIYGRLQQEGIVLVHQSLPAPVAAELARDHRNAGPPARASLRSG